MAETSYDVVVTGAAEGPAGELRLVVELARRRGVPGTRVAEALAAGQYTVATRLDHIGANQLAAELEALGARVTIRASAVAREKERAPVPEAAPRSVQCPRHGLLYDPLTASGCRRCQMETAQERAREQARRRAWGLSPTRRLFVGLGLSLALGFVPAALYAKGPGMAKVEELRARQAALSTQPASHDTTVAFFALDDEVARAYRKTAFVTLAVWLGLAAGLGVGFARVTAADVDATAG